MAQITITEGLSVLKNITARIEKEIKNANLCQVYLTGKAPGGFKTVDEFTAAAKASAQSINDLLTRRDKIKAAIVASNAVTNVTIAGKPYTVAAAIERKTSVEFQREFLKTLSAQFVTSCRQLEMKNSEVRQRLDNLLEQNFGKDRKADNSAVQTITDDFMARNEYKLADPLDAKVLMEKLSLEISDFLTNVDVALSVSNATTFIEV